jgi:hypothetical protein
MPVVKLIASGFDRVRRRDDRASGVNFAGPASVGDSFALSLRAGFHRMTSRLEVATGLLLLIP